MMRAPLLIFVLFKALLFIGVHNQSCIAQSGLLSPSHYLEDIIRLSINTFVVVDDDASSDFDAFQGVALLWCPYSLLLYIGPFMAQNCYWDAFLLLMYCLLHYIGFTLLGSYPFFYSFFL